MKSYQENLFRLFSVTFFLIFISLFHVPVSVASDLIFIRTPSTGYQPQFQVSGNRSYYVWHEYDGPFRQIFTAEMNIDRTGWKAEKRTSGQYDKTFPQLQVVGSKIYYVRQQPDAMKNRQIWTAEMDVDGTGWDGAKRTPSPFEKFEPQLKVLGNKIYFVWRESDGTHFQIWAATMKCDGTGWQAVKRTNSPYDKHNPQLYLREGKIYYVLHQADGPDFRKARYQIWTAQMNGDGSEWKAIQRTDTPFDKYTPKLQPVGDRIYYVWEESDGKYRQIWTAQVNKDGTGWKSERRTKSPYGKYDPQFQIIGNRIYYVWHEDHGPTEPIWVAEEILLE
jgi:hypothetical protein